MDGELLTLATQQDLIFLWQELWIPGEYMPAAVYVGCYATLGKVYVYTGMEKSRQGGSDLFKLARHAFSTQRMFPTWSDTTVRELVDDIDIAVVLGEQNKLCDGEQGLASSQAFTEQREELTQYVIAEGTRQW